MTQPQTWARLLGRWLRPSHTRYNEGRGLLILGGENGRDDRRDAAEPSESRAGFDVRESGRRERPREER